MPERVVNVFEPIEIEEQERDSALFADEHWQAPESIDPAKACDLATP